MLTYPPKVHSGMKNSTKVRSDLNIMHHGRKVFKNLFLCVKSSEPETIDPTPAVVGSLADGAYHMAKVSAVEFYESVIDIVEQWSGIAFWNFYHSWVSVLMDHSDLDFGSVVIFIKAMRDI